MSSGAVRLTLGGAEKKMESLNEIWDMFKERYNERYKIYDRMKCLFRIFYAFPKEEINFWIVKQSIDEKNAL